jgi:hypothetical protein
VEAVYLYYFVLSSVTPGFVGVVVGGTGTHLSSVGCCPQKHALFSVYVVSAVHVTQAVVFTVTFEDTASAGVSGLAFEA